MFSTDEEFYLFDQYQKAFYIFVPKVDVLQLFADETVYRQEVSYEPELQRVPEIVKMELSESYMKSQKMKMKEKRYESKRPEIG